MRLLSANETAVLIDKLQNKDKLLKHYTISLFVDNAFYSDSYNLSDAWPDIITLTPYGTKFLEHVSNRGVTHDKKIEYFTLLRLFYHRDIFIDFEKSKEDELLSALSDMAKSGQVWWPYIFGNKLYHKFNDTYKGDRTQVLDAKSAQCLLSDTQQGVFQIDKLLSGPLGLLTSEESRNVYPTLKVSLWHCSDPGCKAPHRVKIEQHNTELTSCLKSFERVLSDDFGLSSQWHDSILRINLPADKWPYGRPYKVLPYVIADCIIGEERSKLFLRALKSTHNKLLSDVLRNTVSLKGRPEDIASKLSPEELHQLLLLLPDRALIDFIDELISCKEIKIPPAEVRISKTPRFQGSKDKHSEISSLGIRHASHPPVIKLASLIWNTYEQIGKSEDLTWRLRGHNGSTLRHSIIDFIRTQSPEMAIRELILPSKEVTTSIGERLFFSILHGEPEKHIVNRLLWKCGFNIARHEDDYMLLRERIAEFKNCILQLSIAPDEKERAKVRSTGVNLFVSVELFLENLLCYNCWLLTSDHFTGTSFCYSKGDALLSVTRTLGADLMTGEVSFHWCNDGNNTLGGLLAYLQAFRSWLKNRVTADKSVINRKTDDFPFYSKDTTFIFPFNHTELWADVPSSILAAYIEMFDKIYLQLSQSEIASIRNGIDHKREEGAFPEADKMLACVTRILEALDIADSMRLIPKLYWGKSGTIDLEGNICNSFVDYRNVSISIWEPSPIALHIDKPLEVPHIIAPFDLLDLPNSNLAFFMAPRTLYTDYWGNYPRRGIIPKSI